MGPQTSSHHISAGIQNMTIVFDPFHSDGDTGLCVETICFIFMEHSHCLRSFLRSGSCNQFHFCPGRVVVANPSLYLFLSVKRSNRETPSTWENGGQHCQSLTLSGGSRCPRKVWVPLDISMARIWFTVCYINSSPGFPTFSSTITSLDDIVNDTRKL